MRLKTLIFPQKCSIISLRMKNKLAFVFSGGFSKGAAHLAIAREFIEKGYELDLYVGTSVGGLLRRCCWRRNRRAHRGGLYFILILAPEPFPINHQSI